MAVAVNLESGSGLGQTVAEPGGKANMHVCVAVNGEKVVRDIVRTILAA
jgi:hypothetical protein